MRWPASLLAVAGALAGWSPASSYPPPDPRYRAPCRRLYSPTPRLRAKANFPINQAPCCRCGAGPGEQCDERTLGRYPWHRARLDAYLTTLPSLLELPPAEQALLQIIIAKVDARTLRWLPKHDEKGGSSVAELAELLQLSQRYTRRLLRRLEDRGLLVILNRRPYRLEYQVTPGLGGR